MGEFGYKIKNYEAGSIYEYNLGVRSHYQTKDAMLTNSLFLDFLMPKLKIYKGKSTRDVICLEFSYGSSSYENQVSKIKKKMKDADEEKKKDYQEILKRIEENKDKYRKCSKEEIRKEFYKDGVTIEYKQKVKNGIRTTSVHYKMLYRTPGKAKKGSVVFITDRLYKQAAEFLRMGIRIPKRNAPIVELGAYQSLATSTIIDRIRITPEEIVVLKDVDSFFRKDAISIETDKDRHCYAKRITDYKVKNTLFDGQALIDESIFPSWGHGYILLRQHFCKMAAFRTNIQLFMKDYYGDEYETAIIKDMFGNDHLVKDIRLITTDNAMKYLKLGVTYDYWCNWVRKNDCMFGIVKTAHSSKLGNVQRMSYQMVNALNEDTMKEVITESVDYIMALKGDSDVFLEYLDKKKNFSNDYEVLLKLVEQDPSFINSDYFRQRRAKIISVYIKEFRNGRILQNADNLTIVGNPYAMLLHCVGEDPLKDPTFKREEDSIQCYTERFDAGEYLAAFRSPFNSRNNMGYLHNISHEYFKRYFKFGNLIVAVNMIETDFQSRNNGSDQDSDSIYTTNQPEIASHAKFCYENYPTIDNNIPQEKNIYSNTLEDFAKVDNNLSAASVAIGESSNLAQLCLTYSYNFTDQKYSDYVCILSILAQCAIDNAKRAYDIDIGEEISRIKKDMNIEENRYPDFWFVLNRKNKWDKKINADISSGKKENKIKTPNHKLHCPMNYLYSMKFPRVYYSTPSIPMSQFFVKFPMELTKRRCKKVEDLIQKYQLDVYNSLPDEDSDKYLRLEDDLETLLEEIRHIYLSNTYIGLMSWLIDRAFLISKAQVQNRKNIDSTTGKNKSLLLKVLYDINPNCLLKCFSGNMDKKPQ